MSQATGIEIPYDAAAVEAGQMSLEAGGIGNVLVMWSERGLTLIRHGCEPLHLPIESRAVVDGSGAGDTLVATLAVMLAHGVDIAEAALQKVVEWRRAGIRIGFTNGCFDLIHPGHVRLLAKARAQCDRLVVGLNTDASVRRLKGPTRPVQTQMARATVMASIGAVDLVVLFDEETPLELISALRPDVLFKGADYRIDQVVGREIVEEHGGRVVLIDLEHGHSTTRIIERINTVEG